MAVDSQPGPGYGRLEILQLPQNTGIDGPQQVHDAFEADTSASSDLSLWRKGGSTVTFGNLVTVPLGGGLLSTQPLYVSSSAAGSYPALKRVFAYFDGQVGYAPTLQGALGQVLGTGPAPRPPRRAACCATSRRRRCTTPRRRPPCPIASPPSARTWPR